MIYNNAGDISPRQAPNPEGDNLRVRCEIAAKACFRWVRRLENATARLPDPQADLSRITSLEQQAQAILHGPKRPAGLQQLVVEVWLETGLEERVVALDPARTPHEQAQEWIAQVRKHRRGLAVLESRRQVLEAEWLEATVWKERVDAWLTPAEAIPRREIRQRQTQLDLLAARLLPRGLWPQPPRTRDTPPPSGPIRWDLPGGWILLAGRSGTENDLLTQRIALAHDLWFHAAHVPGSHVILRSPNGKPAAVPPELLETAAGVAAWLSKLRAQGIAEVHVTEKRHVRKPRKAPPGTVVLDHSRTLRVKPVPPPRDAQGG